MASETTQNPVDLRFDLAYSQMLAEVAPSMLHEINNPLTTLLTTASLLQSDNRDDASFALGLSELGKSVDTIVALTRYFEQTLKAAGATPGIQLESHCVPLVRLLNARLKNDKMRPELDIAANLPSIALTARQFNLVFFAALTACRLLLQSNKPAGQKEISLRIDARQLSTRICKLAFSLQPVQVRGEMMATDQLISPAANRGLSPRLRFTFRQTLRTMAAQRIGFAWLLEPESARLALELPCLGRRDRDDSTGIWIG